MTAQEQKTFSPSLVEKIVAIVGVDNFKSSASELEFLSVNTLDSKRNVLGCVYPTNQDQVVSLVKLFNEFDVAYYPVSTGRNWGYGGTTPVENNCVVMSLSKLNRIIEFNQELGYIVVEPGVTQQILYDFLQENSEVEFMVPTTGAGPNVSLIGNALERGYGITPIEDHFKSLLSIKSVLADGRIYKSALHDAGGNFSDRVFKWKIGPYMDGLFTQSNLGVTIEGSIALARRPENVTQFVAYVRDENFESAVAAVRKIKHTLGSIAGGVNLMNKRRILSMLESNWSQEHAMEEIHVIRLAKKRDFSDWVMVGALYGNQNVVKSALKFVRSECRQFEKFVSLDRTKIKWAERFLKIVPIPKLSVLLSTAGRALEILEGKPSTMALPLAYLKNSMKPTGTELNPDRDGSGLIWFAPLVPLEPAIVRDFAQEAVRICLLNNMDPLITLTTISDRCFDATIPLLFNKQNIEERNLARRCFEQLIELARVMGIFPYRLDIDHGHLIQSEEFTSSQISRAIKMALDPKNLIAPGRYSYPSAKSTSTDRYK